MRVIAGNLGGRRLQAPPGRRTRPTAERVREALFSMLEQVTGERVLDLFAGSGALGIEALSRGAASAVFVEHDAAAGRVLEANLQVLELYPPAAQVRRQDAFQALRRARRAKETYDLVFIDPPYGQGEDWGRELSSALMPVLGPAARIVVESDRRAPLRLEAGVERQKRYGDTSVTIHRHHEPK